MTRIVVTSAKFGTLTMLCIRLLKYMILNAKITANLDSY